MIIVGQAIVRTYFASHASDAKIKAARSAYQSWAGIAATALWQTPHETQAAYPKTSILSGGRAVFNIKANDYRLICRINYAGQIVEIRWFGSHEEYDRIDSETI